PPGVRQQHHPSSADCRDRLLPLLRDHGLAPGPADAAVSPPAVPACALAGDELRPARRKRLPGAGAALERWVRLLVYRPGADLVSQQRGSLARLVRTDRSRIAGVRRHKPVMPADALIDGHSLSP